MNSSVPGLVTILSRKRIVIATFVVLHLLFLLLLIPRIAGGETYGDVSLYRQWAFQGLSQGNWQGVDVAWVYPIVALVPMVAAAAFGYSHYMLGWFLICVVLNFFALVALLRSKATLWGWQSAYLWIVLTAILGPLVFSRVDGISAPIVVVGLVIASSRPTIASALLSTATWIKVWPAGVVLALVVVSKARLRVISAGAAVSAVAVFAVISHGGVANLFGFIQAQSDRGMQLEAPLTTPGLWQAVLGLGTHVHPNFAIATMEIEGSFAKQVGNLMNPLLAVVVVLILVMIHLARRRGVGGQNLLTVGALALVSAMIVFNKVGSPQFMIWLIAVICVGAAFGGREWAVPVILVLAIAVLTTLVYPILYVQLYSALNPGVAALLTLRNLLVIAVLGWALLKLLRLVRHTAEEDAMLTPSAEYLDAEYMEETPSRV
jgi:hypothetical protein